MDPPGPPSARPPGQGQARVTLSASLDTAATLTSRTPFCISSSAIHMTVAGLAAPASRTFFRHPNYCDQNQMGTGSWLQCLRGILKLINSSFDGNRE